MNAPSDGKWMVYDLGGRVGRNEGARKREDDRRKEGMKEIEQRKSGVKSLSANKTWPWQRIGMYL